MKKQKLIKVYKTYDTKNSLPCHEGHGIEIDETLRLTENEYSRLKKYQANISQLGYGDIIRMIGKELDVIDVYKCCHARSARSAGEDCSFTLLFQGFGGIATYMHEGGYTIEKINKKSFMEALHIRHIYNPEKKCLNAKIEGDVDLEKLVVEKKLKF